MDIDRIRSQTEDFGDFFGRFSLFDMRCHLNFHRGKADCLLAKFGNKRGGDVVEFLFDVRDEAELVVVLPRVLQSLYKWHDELEYVFTQPFLQHHFISTRPGVFVCCDSCDYIFNLFWLVGGAVVCPLVDGQDDLENCHLAVFDLRLYGTAMKGYIGIADG